MKSLLNTNSAEALKSVDINKFISKMEPAMSNPSAEKVYVITNDLVPYTEMTINRILSKKARYDIRQIGAEINKTVRSTLPDVKFLELDYDDLKKEFSRLESQSILPVVTLDPFYSSSNYCLQCNRIDYFNEKGVYIKDIGARPGFPRIEKQIENLAEKMYKKDVCLSDIGSWTGGTLVDIEKKMRNCGFSIKEMIIGFAGVNAAENLRKNGFKSSIGQLYSFYDWLEQRDFVLAGRTWGNIKGDPYLIGEKIAVRVPYWASGEAMTEWASIPEEKAQYASDNLRGWYYKFLDVLEDDIDEPIKVKDLGLVIPKPSDKDFSIDVSPDDEIKQILQRVWSPAR